LSEQYGLLWENVSIPLRTLTIRRSKNGTMRHVPLNQAAVKALEALRKRSPASECVCGGAKEPRRWFEPVLKEAEIANFSWHCLRHTLAAVGRLDTPTETPTDTTTDTGVLQQSAAETVVLQ
jgi:integrase